MIKKLLTLLCIPILISILNTASFATPDRVNVAPAVKTSVVRYIGLDTATAGGVIVSNGGETIIRAGVCYSKNPQPTINDMVVERTGSADSFSCQLRNLTMQQAYYIKAFVETSSGITYGPQRTFATDPAVNGAFVQGGFLFYILQPGDAGYVQGEVHGLVVANNFSTTTYSWRNTVDTLINATDSAVGTGALNTQKIVSIQGAGEYAAKICDDLVLNGYSDWYLPAADELILLTQSKAIPGTLSQYWSSTEVSKTHAVQSTVTSKKRNTTKSTKYRVVAIRKF